jgi:hypothetical protein
MAMRRAHQQKPARSRRPAAAISDDSHAPLAVEGPATSVATIEPPEPIAPSENRPEFGSAETQVLLSPAGTFIGGGLAGIDYRADRLRQLAIAIRQRIESRLGGRVRDLAVRIAGDKVVLEGECSTYYTKQLAQHAALGVLEDEQLDNAIVVEVRR